MRISVFLLSAVSVVGDAADEPSRSTYALTPTGIGHKLLAPNGDPVLQYVTKKPAGSPLTANSTCSIYPLLTPNGVSVVDFAPPDHPHHRGLFLAWHSLTTSRSRADFWGWGEWAPTRERRIVNRNVELAEATSQSAKLRIRNEWLTADTKYFDETLTVSVSRQRGANIVDLTFELVPALEVTIDRTAFGGLCLKGRNVGGTDYLGPRGKVSLPQPDYLKPETDWPPEAWYAYTVDIRDEGRITGVIIDHPTNPPSTWHNVAQIAMVNPCIMAPRAVHLKKGKPLTLRYRVLAMDGRGSVEVINELARNFRR